MNFGELKGPFSSLSYALAASADRGLNPTRKSSLASDNEEFLPNYWIKWTSEKQKSVKLWWAAVPETACPPLIACGAQALTAVDNMTANTIMEIKQKYDLI